MFRRYSAIKDGSFGGFRVVPYQEFILLVVQGNFASVCVAHLRQH